ncbi:MAG TPA: YfiR family protein [Chthoniobacterales bacterium]|jgi:hypothetical protein
MRQKLLSLLVALAVGGQLFAADPSLEYQVKAACVLNAARFVSWPASAFPGADAPLIIGILGENPFGSTLQEVVSGATVRHRLIAVRRVGLAEARDCHIVFVSRSERDNLDAILSALGDANVLTISEIDRFVQSGGTIGLALDQGKIRFEINQEAASRARLKIDSQFLLLARGGR